MKKSVDTNASKRHIVETSIYVVAWLIVFLLPVIGGLLDILDDRIREVTDIRWRDIIIFWYNVLPFFILFLINNFILAPYLFMRRRYVLYFISIVALALFTFSIPGTVIPSGERYTPTEIRRMHEQSGEHTGIRNYIYTYSPDGDSNELYLHFDRPLIGRVLMVLLMFSFNIAVKQFVKSMRDKVVMQELERNNLENELQYLKYQINPHFFMNTLNNIHALIDIDAEKAQSTLMELAKLMRYVLYEANSQTILLSKEVQFLTNYVELMRIRYPEGLQVELNLPENPGIVQVPPLLFILMVENAFKHGVSYLQPSFISCHMWLEERTLLFSCTNSKNAAIKENAMGDRHHGIGLDNMQKRLYLLFGDNYRLSINDTAETFNVELSIPVSS